MDELDLLGLLTLNPGTGTEFFDIAKDDADTAEDSTGEKAMELFAEMEHNVNTNTALSSACEKGKAKEATELHGEMQQRSLSPLDTCTALISACEKGDEVEEAYELAAMQPRDTAEDSTGELEAENELTSISACEKGHKTEKAMDLVPDNLRSNMHTYNVDISAYDESDEVKLDQTPNVNTYSVVISACEKR